MDYSIGIDIGTTSTKALLYHDNQVVASSHQGYKLFRDETGMAEENQADILNAVAEVLRAVMTKVNFQNDNLACIAFSSANQSLIALDKDFHSLTRLQTWADTRSAKYAAELKATPLGKKIYQNTGTPIHPMSLLAKIMWLKREEPEIFQKAAYYCGIKEYVIYHLFGAWQMDMSVASCTGLFNIRDLAWDEVALQTAGITAKQLPPIVDVYQKLPKLKPKYASLIGCPEDVTFIQGAFDGALSNVGLGATEQGVMALTVGTSGALRVITDHTVLDEHARTFCYLLDSKHYVVGGSVNSGGSVYEWAVRNLLPQGSNLPYEQASSLAAQSPAGAHGLIFYPFLGGERAPLWDANARGAFFGLGQVHDRSDMIRAVLEGIAYNLKHVLQILEKVVGQPDVVLAAGGLVKSKLWCQILADILEYPVIVPADVESSCLGANIVGLKAVQKITAFKDAAQQHDVQDKFLPTPANLPKYQQLFKIYRDLLPKLQSEFAAITAIQKEG
ncbi:gluconokinase [Lactobacillus sp. ESL0679]|uniref:gluconokinase n=1 Tax=Lactobacillus sp. ESL0679 TaxID=2983209 RepID=UPI0023F896B8|nr:gluconokinase [Lactobacillus sp. ESL0679]